MVVGLKAAQASVVLGTKPRSKAPALYSEPVAQIDAQDTSVLVVADITPIGEGGSPTSGPPGPVTSSRRPISAIASADANGRARLSATTPKVASPSADTLRLVLSRIPNVVTALPCVVTLIGLTKVLKGLVTGKVLDNVPKPIPERSRLKGALATTRSLPVRPPTKPNGKGRFQGVPTVITGLNNGSGACIAPATRQLLSRPLHGGLTKGRLMGVPNVIVGLTSTARESTPSGSPPSPNGSLRPFLKTSLIPFPDMGLRSPTCPAFTDPNLGRATRLPSQTTVLTNLESVRRHTSPSVAPTGTPNGTS